MLKIIFCNNIKGIIPCFLTFSVIIEKFDVVPIPESVCKLFFFSGTFGIFVHFVHGALKFHNNEHNIGLFNIIMVSTGIPGIFPGKFSCNIISLIPPPVYSPPSNISALSLWSYHSSYTESLIFLCPFPPPSFFFLFVFFLYFLGIFKISSSFFYLLFLVTGAVLNSLNDPLKNIVLYYFSQHTIFSRLSEGNSDTFEYFLCSLFCISFKWLFKNLFILVLAFMLEDSLKCLVILSFPSLFKSDHYIITKQGL